VDLVFVPWYGEFWKDKGTWKCRENYASIDLLIRYGTRFDEISTD